MSIFLYSITPSYSAGGLLAYALNKYCDKTIAWFNNEGTEQFGQYYNAKYGLDKNSRISKEIYDSDQWIFCGGKSYIKFFSHFKINSKGLGNKKIKVILTDSEFCRRYMEWSNILRKNRCIVFAMPDVFPYCNNISPIPYYPPVDVSLDNISILKSNVLTICHSPFEKNIGNKKGSGEIVRIIDELKIKYPSLAFSILTNSGRHETLTIKAKSNIFIDQLVYKNPNIPLAWGTKMYQGGCGKSGCEAMFLKTLVFTGSPKPDTGNYFPSPPVCWVDYLNCQEQLEYYIDNEKERIAKTNEQFEWAKKYLCFEFVAKHVYDK